MHWEHESTHFRGLHTCVLVCTTYVPRLKAACAHMHEHACLRDCRNGKPHYEKKKSVCMYSIACHVHVPAGAVKRVCVYAYECLYIARRGALLYVCVCVSVLCPGGGYSFVLIIYGSVKSKSHVREVKHETGTRSSLNF